MAHRYRSIVLTIVAICCTTTAAFTQQKKTDKNVQVIGGSVGTEFWIAIPPNDFANQPTTSLDIQVASAYNTEITVTDFSADASYRRQINANEIRVLTDRNGETNWSWEVREYEQVARKAVRLTSPLPISVYVMNGKYVTSDGYLAIPAAAFGKKYISTSYYDFNEVRPWPGGFLIIAKENGTVVNIKLRGTGKEYARTYGGKQIGDEFQISMEQGDVYCIVGDARTRGIFDITGTEVTSNNPIGMISFHNRTTMPNLLQNGNGRDHMVEMTPPVDTWGKKYVTVEYTRQGNNPAGKGDVFRVIASQPNTTWSLKFYNKENKALIGQTGGRLAQAGDFADLGQSAGPTHLTSGYSVWEADKPIFVMQYSCSANFDGDQYHDPFMINVVPQEQFIPNTLFQSPTDNKFMIHRLNLIVWADVNDPNYIDNLKSLEIDDIPVWQHPRAAAPTLLFNHMGDNLHWTQINFPSEATAHRIVSNGKVKFGGYIYGFGAVDSYGWPAASGFRPTLSIDTMPPLLTYTENCGDFEFEATELRNIPDPPLPTPRDTDQVETGVALIDTVFGENSHNYRLVHITSEPPLSRDPSFKRYRFRWEVIDKTKDAYCVFDVYDWANNYTRDTIWYYAPKLEFEPRLLDFGKLRLGTSASLPLRVTNKTGEPVELLTSTVLAGTYFTITANNIPPAVTLPDGGSVVLTVTYTGTRETQNVLSDFDLDTIEISTECAPFRVGLVGVAAIPRIVVDDFNAGIRSVNEQHCKGAGIRIQNPGSDTLIVTNIVGHAGTNFSVSNPTTPPLPITVLPKGEVFVKDICYERGNVGQDSIDVVFVNNGDGPDSVSTWVGQTQEPGPRITGYDWLKRRVNTRHQALIQVSNTGNEAITLRDVTFADGTKFYPPGSNDANFVFKIGAIMQGGTVVATPSLANGASVDVVVEFRPAARQVYSQLIRPVWAEQGIVDVTASLDGEGILPTITTTGAAMTCLETPPNNAAVRDLVITNDGNMDLTCSVQFANGSDPNWNFVAPPPPPTFTVSYLPGNNVVRIPVSYTRPAGYNGGSNLIVEITHDAVPGNGQDTAIDGPVMITERFDVGSCVGPDIQVIDIDYGRQLANCDQPNAAFTITNTGGGTTGLEIRDLQIVDADAAAFQIVNIIDAVGAPLTLPFVIQPQQTVRVFVRFTPTEPNAAPWTDRNYAARVRVWNYEQGQQTELRPNVYVNLRGVGYVIPFTFALTNNRQGATVRPDIDPQVQFTVSGTGAFWQQAQVTSFTADMIYETASFAYTPGSVAKVNLPGDWTVNEPVRTDIGTDGIRSRLRFTGNGTTPIQADGNLFTFTGTLLLNSNFEQLQALQVDLEKPCFIVSTSGSSTAITNCALAYRLVDVSRTRFSIQPPSPNPVTSDVARLEFGIGIKAPATVDLLGSSGEVVATLVDQVLAPGEYSLSIPLNAVSNGVYTVRISCSDYFATVPMVVAR